MAIYKTITPVHIGTGNEIPGFEYHWSGNRISRYLADNILKSIPPRQLLNTRMLEDLARYAGKTPEKKEAVYRQLQSFTDFGKLHPIYTCALNVEYPDEIIYKNVSEQIKTLDTAYIPGSTLKGAIENAFRYQLLKDHYDRIGPELPQFLQELGNRSVKEGFILTLLGERKGSDEFFRNLFGCLICQDVPFRNMEVLQGCRLGKTERNDIPIPYTEVISPAQETQGPALFVLDEKKLERMRENATAAQSLVLDSFNDSYLKKACTSYTLDMLQSDLTPDMKRYFEDQGFEYLYAFCQDLKRKIETSPEDTVYLRVGKYTNYFYKTVSWLVKTRSFRLYSEYFQQAFSPLGRSKKGASLDPRKMPSTRTVLWNYDNAWLLGFLEIRP